MSKGKIIFIPGGYRFFSLYFNTFTLAILFLTAPAGGTAAEDLASEDASSAVSGIVTAGILSVRARPGTTYEVISRLERGQTVKIVSGINEKWYEIIAPPDSRAWCAAHFIDSQGRITADKVNVRAGPGLVFSPFATLERGELVQRKGEPKNGWQQIEVPSAATAWIYSQHVDPVEPLDKTDDKIEKAPPAVVELFVFDDLLRGKEEKLQTSLLTAEEIKSAEQASEHLIISPLPVEKMEEETEVALVPLLEIDLQWQDETDADIELEVEAEIAAPTDERATGPADVGRVASLERQRTSYATHVLLEPDSDAPRARAYLISDFINLNQWQGRVVRVYGEEDTPPDWTLPIVRVKGIQLWESVPGQR